MKLQALVFVCAIATVLGATRVAAAAPLVVRDGTSFDMTLRDGVRACMAVATGTPDTTGCEGTAHIALPQATTGTRTFAVGLVRAGEARAALTAIAMEDVELAPLTVEGARDFGEGVAKSVLDGVPGATMRGKPDVKVLDLRGVPVVRIAIDLDNVPADKAILAHLVALATVSDKAFYSVSFTTSPAHAAEIDALADEAARTIHMTHPAAARPSAAYELGKLVGQLSVYAMAGLVALYFVLRRRRGK